MLTTLLKRLLALLLISAMQVMVFNHMHLLGYATPMIGVLFFAYLPLNAGRTSTLCWAFALGLVMDFFSGTPGQQSGALTLTAFVQPLLLQALAPKESAEDMVPNFRTLGRTKHTYYLLALTALHHLAYYLLEFFAYYRLTDFLITLGSSTVLSMTIILSVESLRGRKPVSTHG